MRTKLKRTVKDGIKTAAQAFNKTFGAAITPEMHVISTPRNMNPGTYLAIIRGTYERAERSLLGVFNSAGTIIELGSNIGVVSSTAIDKLPCFEKLVCVEPNPDSVPSLKKNVDRALARNAPYTDFLQTTFVEAAIGMGGGTMPFIRRPGLDSGLVGQVAGRDTDGTTIDVPVKSLSEILRENDVNGVYSLICDIEGGEIPLIYEDADALRYCASMLIELHPTSLTGSDIDQNAMLARLQSMGFQPKANIDNTYMLERRFQY